MDTSDSTGDAGFLTIADVCNELRTPHRALQFYEGLGLVAPRRDRSRRLYSTADVHRLRTIVELKPLGLSLREIREVIQSPSDGPFGLSQNLCEEAFNRLNERRAAAEA